MFCSSLNLVMSYTSTVPNVSTTRSKLGREDIKWSELLSHFRNVQNKHEKARRQAAGDTLEDMILPLPTFSNTDSTGSAVSASVGNANGNSARPGMRRRVTGGTADAPMARPSSRTLSPLNPRRGSSSAQGQPSGLREDTMSRATTATTTTTTGGVPTPSSPTFSNIQNQRGPKRALSLSRKT
jgi:vacuole morphology and inheritance protein 14